jgi:hypothetical protein
VATGVERAIHEADECAPVVLPAAEFLEGHVTVAARDSSQRLALAKADLSVEATTDRAPAAVLWFGKVDLQVD